MDLGPPRAQRLRGAARRIAAAQAEQLTLAAELLAECRADVPRHGTGSTSVADADALAQSLAEAELSVTLGISGAAASRMLSLATRLSDVLPCARDALSAGVLDLPRVRVLAEATEVLDGESARAVATAVIDAAGESPWDGPSPRAWQRRVERAVVRADVRAAERRRAAAVAARRVRAWSEADGVGVLQLRASDADVAMVDQVLSDLAVARPQAGADGTELTMDQRRADAFVDVFRWIRNRAVAAPGGPPSGRLEVPRVTTRRIRDVGLVLHEDTLFGSGPDADELGELRGLGAPSVVDPRSAARLAARELSGGSGLQVMVVDATGALRRLVPLEGVEAGRLRTRGELHEAVRAQLARLEQQSPQTVPRYAPTRAIAGHVRAEAPTCSFYDCPRQARACDLDHDEPWPRGPTCVTNLDPKCRRHHQLKSHQLVRSRLRAGPGSGPRVVAWTLRSGLSVTTSPQPLPGARGRHHDRDLSDAS